MSRSSKNKTARKVGRFIGRLIGILIILFLSSIIYLNVIGVPHFLLKIALNKLRASGVYLDVGRVTLTLQGWEASHLRYYSEEDGLEPVLSAETVYFRRDKFAEAGALKRYTIEGKGLNLLLPESLCVGIPKESQLYEMDSIQFVLGVSPKEIAVKNASMNWMGANVRFKGSLRNLDQKKPSKPIEWLPVIISPEQYAEIERWIDTVQYDESATLDVGFLIDYAESASSYLRASVSANDVQVREVSFDQVEIAAAYEDDTLSLERASFTDGDQSLELVAQYDVTSGGLEGELKNRIQNKALFSLVPASIMNELKQNDIQLIGVPLFDIKLEPAPPGKNRFSQLSGIFALEGLTVGDLELASIAGEAAWDGSRLKLTELQSQVVSQEHRSEETGSCMRGGAIKGKLAWDSRNHRVEIAGEAECDPNLFHQVLSVSHIAQDVIADFKFMQRPPKGTFEVNFCYDDWHTFELDLQVSAEELTYLGVPLSSLDSSTIYKDGVLDVESVLAKQGIKYLKGQAVLDYDKSVVSFDGVSTMAPAAVEDLTFHSLELFGHQIEVSGDADIAARGRIDWGTMRTTDFEAEIKMSGVKTPAMMFDSLTSKLVGKGPVIDVKDAVFSGHGGTGAGSMSVLVNPPADQLPYKLDIQLDSIDLDSWLKFLDLVSDGTEGNGDVYGWLKADADLKKPFMESASGEGRIDIKNGRLTDLPLFNGLSKVVRLVFPSFKMLSINRANADFTMNEGVIHSDNAYFDGDVLSAKGSGDYSVEDGFDMEVQVQLLNDNKLFVIIRLVTDPVLGLLELKLGGTFSDPTWKVNTPFD
ncbi:MAG: hypothetical protein JXR40_02005 [Pontiellaceae bacterium]|nr:hypothetical protein [Pontiellaceae bacterium]